MNKQFHAFILHRRAFRDTSLLIDFLTLEEGLISVVAKGAKRLKSTFRNALQFFNPLLIDCYGHSELLGLKSVEIEFNQTNFNSSLMDQHTGNYLLTLLYVNELLYKLLHKQESQPKIFWIYQQLLLEFKQQKAIEPALRKFEIQLLAELGYQLTFDKDAHDTIVTEHSVYTFCLAEGLKPALGTQKNTYTGALLQQIYKQEFHDKLVLNAAKQLFREIFAELLQHKTINSRQLFMTHCVKRCSASTAFTGGDIAA